MLAVGVPVASEERSRTRDSGTSGLALALERTLLRKGEGVGKGGDPYVSILRG